MKPVCIWGLAHTQLRHFSPGFADNTMQLTIASPIAGGQIRLRFSNREGTLPYTILAGNIQINSGNQTYLSFNGKNCSELAPGADLYCDILPVSIHSGDLITIRLAFAGKVMSGNGIAEVVHASKKGNFVEAPQFDTVKRKKIDAYRGTYPPIGALASIEIVPETEAHALICFGDSITQQSQWTKPLSMMMSPHGWTVINKGIGGNRLLSDPMFKAMGMYGRKGLDRFEQDVLKESGASAMILAIGTNDLGMCRDPHGRGGITAEMLMEGLTELTEKAHGKEMQVFCATITPRTGCFGWKPSHEKERQHLNQLIRECKLFDGCLDFDAAIRNPIHPEMMDMSCDSGDHLHPGVLGGQRMADAAFRILEASNLW